VGQGQGLRRRRGGAAAAVGLLCVYDVLNST
jgi:hypothetical protein